MQNTKLIDLLSTFSKEEMKEFVKFTASPFFSRGRDLSPLLNELVHYFPDFDHKSFSAEHIYEKLYPGKKYGDAKSDSIMKTLSSDLFKLAKEFLVYIELNNDENNKKLYTLKQLRQRKLYKEFEKEFSSVKKDVNDMDGVSLEDFHKLYKSQAELTSYSIEKGKHQAAVDSLIAGGEYSLMHALIKAYMNIDLKETAGAYNTSYRHNFGDILLENLDSDKMLDEMKKEGNALYPFTAVYYMVYMMNKHTEKEEYFYRLKELLNEHIDLFAHTEKYMLLGIMASYCTRKSFQKYNEQFTREQFEVNDLSLKLGVYKYSPKDDFQLNTFRNVMVTAIDLNEIDWLENFIETYYKELNPEYRDNMRYLSLAHLHFARADFERSLSEIIKVKYDFFLYPMDVKYLTFKIYFELKHYEQAISTLSAIASYISTTKDLSQTFKQRGTSFVKIARELLKRRMDNDDSDLDFFRGKALEAPSLNSRHWILEKIDQLKNVRS